MYAGPPENAVKSPDSMFDFLRRRKIRCPDGTVKWVYHRVDDAFPLFIPGWSGNLDAQLKVLADMPAQAKAAYETKIQGVLFGLDARNQSLMMQFRGAYIAYSNDPCPGSAFFLRQVEKLLDEQRELAMLLMKTQALLELAKEGPANHDQVMVVFRDLVGRIGGPAVAEAAENEVADARSDAKKWIKGRNGGNGHG
jgi:hypothetical protein